MEQFIDTIITYTGKLLYWIFENIVNRKKLAVIGKPKKCSISVPVYTKNIFNEKLGVIILDEAKRLCSLFNFCEHIGKTINIFDDNTDRNNTIEFVIGSPIVNYNAQNYFIDFFPNIKFLINEENFKNSYHDFCLKPRNNKASMFIYDNSYEQAIKCLKSNKILDYIYEKKDYAFIIKLSPNDFINSENRVVHIFFGLGRAGTREAVNFFIYNYKLIYKKFKNKHYCIALPITENKQIKQREEYQDLTNDFFVK